MKTSSSQFDLMVTFMEQHGDLSKPSSDAKGRISCIKHWEELTELLNSDGSGDIKSTERWKKVWSDYKNNTKKKAARLRRAANGTGSPAVFAKLTDLEKKVLNMVGVPVSTSSALEEEEASQVIHIQYGSNKMNGEIIQTPPPQFSESPQPWNEHGPSRIHLVPIPSPQASTEGDTTPPLSCMEIEFMEREEDTGIQSSSGSSQVHMVQTEPARSGQTTPRAKTTPHGSAQRRPRRYPDLTLHFLRAERHWRKFKAQQHRDYMEIKREQSRIREMEIEIQRQWQSIGSRVLDMLDKLVSKYCKD